MKVNILIFLSQFLNFFSLFNGKTYDVFSNETVTLKPEEIAFFESPNYPELYPYYRFFDANLTFNLQENFQSLNINVVVSITYVNTTLNQVTNDIFIFNDLSSYSVRSRWGIYSNFSYEYKYSAVQGYVIFEVKHATACPLQSVSNSARPYHFIDETFIIYLQSVYQNISDSSLLASDSKHFSCKWKFKTPEGYGFKVVLTEFDISTETEFFVKNTTDILMNSRSAILFHPIYNSDKTIDIYLSRPEVNFKLYISVVKHDPIVEDGNCTILIYDEKNFDWYSAGYYAQLSYQNNIMCTYNFTFAPNESLQAYITVEASLEKNTDFLKFHTGTNKSGLIDKSTTGGSQQFLFTPENQYIFFEFSSDGSISDVGFFVQFRKISCECDTNILRCEAFTETSKYKDYVLCRNLHCNFTIQNCKTRLTLIQFKITSNYDDRNLVCRVYSNDVIVFDYVEAKVPYSNYEVFVNSSSKNFIEIITPEYEAIISEISIQSYSFEPPSIDIRFVLSKMNSEFDLDLGSTKAVEFKLLHPQDILNTQSNELIVYGTILTDVFQWPSFLTTDFLTSNLFTNLNCEIFSVSLTYSCKFEIPAFIIYPGSMALSTFVTVKISGRGEETKGCVFEENIFIPKNENNFSVVGIATKDSVCRLKVLMSYSYDITALWTTAKEENVQIFSGNTEEFLLLEFNSQTAKHWTRISLSTSFYIIKIPKGAALFLRLSDNSLLSNKNMFSNFWAIVATPQYGAYKSGDCGRYLIYSIGDYPIQITTLYYKMPANDDVYFVDGKTQTNYTVKKTGDILTFKNQVIGFTCTYTPSIEKDTGAVFLIESLFKF